MTETSSLRDRGWRLPSGGIEVVFTVTDELQRLGLEHMLQSLGPAVRARGESSLETALGRAGRDPATVLIVAWPDVHETAVPAVRAAVAAGARVLVLLDSDDPTELPGLGRIAGCGYLHAAELGVDSLADALERALRGEPVIPPALAANLLATVGEPVPPVASRVRVTPREQEALHLLAQGLSNKQIGRRLGISDHGAKRLVANLMAKLDCPSRTLVVAKAMRVGMLPG